MLGTVADWFLSRTFGGKRDLYEVLGYERELTYAHYLARYGRDDIAGRIVDIPAEATWEMIPRLTEDRKEKSETALSRKFERLADQLKLRQKLETLDVLAGIGRYAVGLIGFRDGRALKDPVGEVKGPEDVLYLSLFSEVNAWPSDIDLDPKSPGFGSPSHWEIDLARGQSADSADQALRKMLAGAGLFSRSTGKTEKVHVSRLIHVAEGTLEDGLYGRPRLRRVWNRLDDLAKVTGGAAETFWMVANRGLQFDIDKELSLTPEDEDALEEQIEKYRHGGVREFKTRGVTIKGLNELGAGNVNPKPSFSVIAALICGSCDIPYRMLFGTERGQGTNAQDQNQWLEHVAVRRKKFASENVLSPFIEKVVAAGALPQLALESQLVWPSPHGDMHQAEVADVITRACKNLAAAGERAAITTGELRERWLGLPAERPEEQIEPPEPQPATAGGGATPGETAPAQEGDDAQQ